MFETVDDIDPKGDPDLNGEVVLLTLSTEDKFEVSSLLIFSVDVPNGDGFLFPIDEDPNRDVVLVVNELVANGDDPKGEEVVFLVSTPSSSSSLLSVSSLLDENGLFPRDDPNGGDEAALSSSFVLVDDIDGVMLPNGDDPNDGEAVLLALLLSLLLSVLDPNGDEDDAIVSFFPNGD